MDEYINEIFHKGYKHIFTMKHAFLYSKMFRKYSTRVTKSRQTTRECKLKQTKLKNYVIIWKSVLWSKGTL